MSNTDNNNAMKTKLVYETAATVEAHNTKHAELIALGMMEKWEQTESAKRDEVKQAAREAKEAKETAFASTLIEEIIALNLAAAQAVGLEPVKLSFDRHYGSSRSMFRSGPFDGITVDFGYDRDSGKSKTRLYRWNKDGKLVTTSLIKTLAEHYANLKAKAQCKAEAEAKAAAAKEAMPAELLVKIGKISGQDVKASMTDSGKIAVTYIHFSQGGYGRKSSSYPVNVFTPMTVAQWTKWVEIQEAHRLALSALTAEAKA